MPPSSLSPNPARVGWLRQSGERHAKVDQLLKQFLATGWNVWVVEEKDLPLEQILCFDLILLETFARTQNEIHLSLSRIRLGSYVPLVMLADDPSDDWVVEMLRAGADAVLTLDVPDEVSLARCKALLRRWLFLAAAPTHS
jgi:DNA-binding response OmpR family regulator